MGRKRQKSDRCATSQGTPRITSNPPAAGTDGGREQPSEGTGLAGTDREQGSHFRCPPPGTSPRSQGQGCAGCWGMGEDTAMYLPP